MKGEAQVSIEFFARIVHIATINAKNTREERCAGTNHFESAIPGSTDSPWWRAGQRRERERGRERRKVSRPCANAARPAAKSTGLSREVRATVLEPRARSLWKPWTCEPRAIANEFHRNLRRAANKRAVYLVNRKWRMPLALRRDAG